MFTWIKQKLGFKSPTEAQVEPKVEPEVEQPAITSNFYIMPNGNIEIDLKFAGTTDEYAFSLAKLLFMINEGYFVQDQLSLLQEHGATDLRIGNFVVKVINTWGTLKQQKNRLDEEDDPIISPDSFTSLPQQEKEE